MPGPGPSQAEHLSKADLFKAFPNIKFELKLQANKIKVMTSQINRLQTIGLEG